MAHTSVGTLFVHLDNEFSADVLVKLTLSDYVVPASRCQVGEWTELHIHRVSYLSPAVSHTTSRRGVS